MKQGFKIVAVLVAIFGLLPMAKATHIVGGELNYRHLGNWKYEIILTVYRDCYNGIPPFDDPASVGIFDKSNALKYELKMQLNEVKKLPLTINDSCTSAPTDVCYEVTTYIDTINLPPIPGGYQLAYQRCCRNKTIVNIQDPLNTGATYYATIPDTSVVTSNGNPRFKLWPPPFLCAGVKLNFDHSAIDPEGDSLVYELFNPFDGATYNDPMPQPPYNPPYNPVVYIGNYNVNNMLNGDGLGDVMRINPKTGLLTCTPNTIGQFVVGMRVKEYRNKVLISETKRDFQFNVLPCPKVVVAAAQVPDVICGSNLVAFQNNSSGSASSLRYAWDFGDLTSNSDTSNLQSPSYQYPDTGIYQTRLIVSDAVKKSCRDTAFATVRLTKAFELFANYSIINCSGNKFLFQASTSLPIDLPVSYNWSFNNGFSSTQQAFEYQFSTPGTYIFKLNAEAQNGSGCEDSLTTQTIEITETQDLLIPNAFTPNGDGENDLFNIKGPALVDFYLAVYNRWGQKVYESNMPAEGWNGYFNNILQDPGVYGYYLKARCKFDEKTTYFKKGNVTLLR